MGVVLFPYDTCISPSFLETDVRSAGEKNAGGANGYQKESGDKKTLEGQTIGQKRKRNDGMNNNVTIK